MSVASQKRIASQILKCGVTRIRITSAKEVEEALTRNDVRELIQKGIIVKIQKRGTTKAYSKVILAQKNKGRRKYDGSKKGKAGARTYDKGLWMNKVRPIRRLLKGLKENKQITNSDYKLLYSRTNGGFFRDKKHIMNYIKEHRLFKDAKKPRKTPLEKTPIKTNKTSTKVISTPKKVTKKTKTVKKTT